jgi:ATP-dependent helicase/nuclease subunit B
MDLQVNFIKINSEGIYLDECSKETLKIISNNTQDYVIILPSYFACENFKLSLLKSAEILYQKSALLLPEIITSEIFIKKFDQRVKDKFSSKISHIVKMSIIAKKYIGLEYSLAESLSISSELVEIFWKLKSSSVSVEEIRSWIDQDIAEHWWEISKFLENCFEEFEMEIIKSENDKINSQANFKKYIVIGDISEISKYKKILYQSDITFFLPDTLSLTEDITSEYSKKLLSYYISEGYEPKDDIKVVEEKRAKFVQFMDLQEETKYIVDLVVNSDKRISIVTENSSLKDLLASEFEKYGRIYNTSFGNKYIFFEEANLLLGIAKFRVEAGSFLSFINILTSQLLIDNQHVKSYLEQLNSSNKYYENMEDLIGDLKDEKISSLFDILKSWLEFDSANLHIIFLENYSIFKKIYNLFECKSEIKKAEKFFSLIDEIKEFDSLGDSDFENYFNYLSLIFSMKYTVPFDREATLFITNYEDSYLIDSDLTIFCDFNDESVLKGKNDSIWLSSKILKKLNISTNSERFNYVLYLIALKMNCGEIVFTRSLFSNGAPTELCPVINFISKVDVEAIKKYGGFCIQTHSNSKIRVDISSMPKILYPTNIEQLLRNPYGFFCRKILSLKEKFNILSNVDNSEFGKIVHEIIERISKGNSNIENIIDSTFDSRNLPNIYRQLWKTQLSKIASKIECINSEVYKNLGEIFTEIEGRYKICQLSDLEIAAKADRIELYDNKIIIADFKTGSPPSFKEVESSKYPQLIIEAIILINNGFREIIYNCQEIEILFYKVKTSEPYIEATRKTISFDEIKLQEKGMIKFLSYYYSKANIDFDSRPIPEFWAAPFDSYQHLRRH